MLLISMSWWFNKCFFLASATLSRVVTKSFGRLPTWIPVDTQWTAERWASGLVPSTTPEPHASTMAYRNALVHFKGSTSRLYLGVFRGFSPTRSWTSWWGFWWTRSSPVDRSYIYMEMETATSAAEHSSWRSDIDKLRRKLLTHYPHFTPKAVAVVPVKDSEGSIKYKRRRRKPWQVTVSSIVSSTNFSFYERGCSPTQSMASKLLLCLLRKRKTRDMLLFCY